MSASVLRARGRHLGHPDQISDLFVVRAGAAALIAASLIASVGLGVGRGSLSRVAKSVVPDSLNPPNDQLVTNRDEFFAQVGQSLVKVTGDTSCDEGLEGSGTVIAKRRVLTNAHVVAGVARPMVQVTGLGKRLPGRVVYFNPQLDVAVLAVPDLTAPPMPLGRMVSGGTDGIVVGFPNNERFQASAARVRGIIQATGDDIYGQEGAEREVYSLYASVREGNSGGPLIDPKGRFLGLVFAKATDDPNTGYALTLNTVKPILVQAPSLMKPVEPTECVPD